MKLKGRMKKNLNIRKTKKFNQLKYHPEKSQTTPKISQPKQSQNDKKTYADMTRKKSFTSNTARSSRSRSNNRNHYKNDAKKAPSSTNQQNRQKQIEKLQSQINALKDANREEQHSKNFQDAPPRGAATNQTEISPTDVLEFISTAIAKLNEFAKIFEKKDNMPRTRQGTW